MDSRHVARYYRGMIDTNSATSMQLLANGFLPTRASWVLDTVFVAMFAICLALAISVSLVRFGKQFSAHRSLQLSLAAILVVAIVVFEIDVRFVTDWRALAESSQFYKSGWVDRSLYIHLAFAIPTPFIWGCTIWQAIRKFPNPPHPGAHSAAHRWWGRLSVLMMTGTAVTGCAFYWLAFAC